jgi:UDP-2-acetamido-3-amino-2,3-dideoxy-glucuronate N-acetyltransferase
MLNGVFIHPSAIVETDLIGRGTRIWAFSHVMKNASIGVECNIGDHSFIESGAIIGNYVTIKNGNMIWEGVTLEDGVFVGPHVFFTNDLYPRSQRLPEAKRQYQGRAWLLPTIVRRGASLGAGAILLAGLTVGEFAMVGAGSVVTADVPSYAMIIGNPARKAGWACQCGQPLRFDERTASCAECRLGFVKDGDAVRPSHGQEG